jgi:hypothetical protein
MTSDLVSKPVDAYVAVSEEPAALVSSYVDLKDLQHCLRLYFDGQLNNIPDANLQRLWMPLERLIPSNSLESQLTQEDMQSALNSLPWNAHLMLEAHFRHEIEIDRHRSIEYSEALILLADEILKLL